ncbi:sensor histidine kinase [Phaeobacter sp. B1627]|uniref:sensor histidine kinase n=1 Tax=Phaeobacter sp. B1627 TaxID=2583809 RepID=UPI001119211B|nr:histidine kinase dimerization/phosphoacceptor domain -containing protein [Phaeobacter sp. B1627]TNJ47474.1 sensor histidine kinase [Phaeobacter sp. B1627]
MHTEPSHFSSPQSDGSESDVSRRFAWTRNLSVRLAILLSGALVPLGLIAVDQTVRLQNEVTASNNLSLQALTAEFAQEEREVIKSAFTAAETLALTLPELTDDLERCKSLMANFVDAMSERYSFAGFLPTDGVMDCASANLTIDYSENPDFASWMRSPKRQVRVNPVGPVAGDAVLILSEPVFDRDDTFIGNQIIHAPHDKIDQNFQVKLGDRPIDLVTISAEGDILSASGARETARERLPATISLKELIELNPRRIETENAAGQRRLFSIVPVLSSGFYVIGSWDPESRHAPSAPGALNQLLLTPALFPILMWLVSLVLIYVALDRQVVRYLRAISLQMRQFAQSRTLPATTAGSYMPKELEVIEDQFKQMAEKLLLDEATLFDAMHDKDVLLKELHHRVKNNLQLISSIISMQIRRTRNEVTAAALKTVNRRVTSVATVHQTLYQASELGRVQANDLLRDVVRPLTDLAPTTAPVPQIDMELDPIVLYPDQAVPLALLAVEAATNALKYLGVDKMGRRWVRVSLKVLDDEKVTLTIANSTSDTIAPEDEGTGLGSQLIRGFARQLEGNPIFDETDDSYSVSLTFDVMPFEPENHDRSGVEDTL